MNLFIVFLLTGIWHGANFTFLVWGLFHGFWQVLERLFLKKVLDKNPLKLLNHIYALLVVVIGWVYFRSDTVFQANDYVRQMFFFSSSEYSVFSFLSMKVLLMLEAAVLCAGPLQRLLEGLYGKIKESLPVNIADAALQIVILLYSMLLLVSGTYNPFIYFQF